jgi:hypothetical protein
VGSCWLNFLYSEYHALLISSSTLSSKGACEGDNVLSGDGDLLAIFPALGESGEECLSEQGEDNQSAKEEVIRASGAVWDGARDDLGVVKTEDLFRGYISAF